MLFWGRKSSVFSFYFAAAGEGSLIALNGEVEITSSGSEASEEGWRGQNVQEPLPSCSHPICQNPGFSPSEL